MTEAEVLIRVRQNPVNAAILQRLRALGAPQAHLVAGCLFGAVWNVQAGRPPGENVNDYDLFYYDPDPSYGAEDAVIRRAAALFADLTTDTGVQIEVRNQARVHLWFEQKFGQTRPPIRSVREGIDQFLVRCTCLGIDEHGVLYAPCGLDELETGLLRPNPLNVDDGRLYRAKVQSYRRRWPWLREG
ncbi:nucleotidyltransferase family protein [Deinococcus altitudinis]|uniref:nucleotidyltransferase family protein n=1 Tax=Deinococcus altitudinis TaxID=468914 RepID=UPI00389172F3